MYIREGCKGPCEGVCIPCDCTCESCCVGCCIGCCEDCEYNCEECGDIGCICRVRTKEEKEKFKKLQEERDWN